jgi:hypothetical protein
VKHENMLFKEEEAISSDVFQFVSQTDIHAGEMKDKLITLAQQYQDLLEQTKFLTRTSDKLEKKLDTANRHLEEKNETLERTLQELRLARVSKKAFGIIYFIVVILFVLEEVLISPFTALISSMWFSIAFKLLIAVLLKPAEQFLERRLMR